MRILNWGIYLVVFGLPLYLVRFEIFGIPTTVLEAMICTLFIVWGIKYLVGRDTDLLMHANARIIIPITLIVIGVSLATIFSLDLRASAGIWKSWFVDPLLFFIVIVSTIKNLKQVKGVLYSLFLSGSVVSIISLISLIQGKLDPLGRLQAFYNSPNYLAMFLAPALIIGIWFFMKRGNMCFRMYFLASVVILAVISFFTQSYGAWLGIVAAVGLGLFIYLFKSKKRLAWTVLSLVLIIILVLGYLASALRSSSFEARLVIWQEAWQIFKTNPILGIGPGTLGNYFPPYPQWGVPQPHSIYLAFLLQTGIIGFIGFIWLLAWFFRTGIRLFAAHCSLFAVILMSIMVYILIHGLVDTTYWKNDLSAVFWIAVALMAILKEPR